MDPGGWDGMGNILFGESRARGNILYGKNGALSNILYGKDGARGNILLWGGRARGNILYGKNGARYGNCPLLQFLKKFRKASENVGFCENSEILGILRKF